MNTKQSTQPAATMKLLWICLQQKVIGPIFLLNNGNQAVLKWLFFQCNQSPEAALVHSLRVMPEFQTSFGGKFACDNLNVETGGEIIQLNF